MHPHLNINSPSASFIQRELHNSRECFFGSKAELEKKKTGVVPWNTKQKLTNKKKLEGIILEFFVESSEKRATFKIRLNFILCGSLVGNSTLHFGVALNSTQETVFDSFLATAR
jgi:hypothetical protein